MLDALQDAGYQNLKYKTVTVLSDPSPQVDSKLAHDLVQVYEQRTRGVYRGPSDAARGGARASPRHSWALAWAVGCRRGHARSRLQRDRSVLGAEGRRARCPRAR